MRWNRVRMSSKMEREKANEQWNSHVRPYGSVKCSGEQTHTHTHTQTHGNDQFDRLSWLPKRQKHDFHNRRNSISFHALDFSFLKWISHCVFLLARPQFNSRHREEGIVFFFRQLLFLLLHFNAQHELGKVLVKVVKRIGNISIFISQLSTTSYSHRSIVCAALICFVFIFRRNSFTSIHSTSKKKI